MSHKGHKEAHYTILAIFPKCEIIPNKLPKVTPAFPSQCRWSFCLVYQTLKDKVILNTYRFKEWYGTASQCTLCIIYTHKYI